VRRSAPRPGSAPHGYRGGFAEGSRLPAGFFLTRSRGERGGRKIGFSPRAPRLRVNRCRGFSSASRIFSHAEARRARREEDWIFSASPRLRVNLYSPSSNISFLHRCRGFWSAQAAFFLTRSRGERGGRKIGFSPRAPRLRVNRYRGFSFASRIFSHAEARRARRKEDWIFSAPPRLRVNLYRRFSCSKDVR
jgi:hypothetical protein